MNRLSKYSGLSFKAMFMLLFVLHMPYCKGKCTNVFGPFIK